MMHECRSVAQPGRAQRLGRWGRGFKSLRSDQTNKNASVFYTLASLFI